MVVGLRHGLYLGLFLTVYGVFFRLAGIHYAAWPAWVFYLAVPLAVWLAGRALRTSRGELTFGPGLGTGLLTATVGSAIYSVYVFVYNRFVDDSLPRTIVADFRTRFEELGMPAEEIETQIQLVESFMRPAAFASGVFVRLTLLGFVSALLVTAFLRMRTEARPPEPLD